MDGTNLGIITLVPVISFLVIALITKRCILSIMMSGMLGYMIYYGTDFFVPMLDGLLESSTDADNNYIVIIVLLFGCFVQLLRDSNGALAVGRLARKFVHSAKQSLLLTYIIGLIIFIDDYLSILVTASCVRDLTDEYKVPREMLTYVVNTTSAPVCLIIPISAWVVFFSGVFYQQPEAAVVGSTGMEIYYNIMPYFIYPFLCVFFVPLVILGVVPKMGSMKKAYERVEKTGRLWPESSDMMNHEEAVTDKEDVAKESKLWTFVIPMVILIVATIILDDIFYGVVIGILACFFLYIPTKVMTMGECCDSCYKGLEDMLFISVVLVTSLFYRESIALIGMSDYVIEVAGPLMSAQWLPAISFILIGLLSFATGNIWSIPALSTPVILPLAAATGANIHLTLGAIISAACFGAQACFYSDVTLLSASACGINNVDYAIAQLPYIIIVTVISFVLFVVGGYVL